MFHDVTLPGWIVLVPGKPLDSQLRRMVKDHPGLPTGVSQVISDLNRRTDGVAATVAEPNKRGGDHSLLLYTRDYRVRLFPAKNGDAYTVAAIDPIRLKDHDTLAQGCLRLRTRWHAVFEHPQIPAGAEARWADLRSAWAHLLKARGDLHSVPSLSAAHTGFLDTLDRLIDTAQRIAAETAKDTPTYPYRSVDAVGERRFSSSGVYEFHVVGGRVPERSRFVAIRGEPAQRGQVLRTDGGRVRVRFDQPIDWTRLAQQGELEEPKNDVVFAKQREAVGLLRDRRARNPSLLSVLVDHRVQPLVAVPEQPREELDDDQRAAFRRALGVRDMFIVLGPPGTGKTRTICEIARARALAPERAPVLIASHTNRAVDNVLAKLSEDVLVVRVGNEGRVDHEARPFLLETRATDLRGEVLGRVGTAVLAYEGLHTARDWAPELERRTGVFGTALAAEMRAGAELEHVRRAVGGPAQARVDEVTGELAAQEQRMVHRRGKLDRLIQRDQRARARRWWPPFAAWADARARGRARRIETGNDELARMAAAAGQLRTAVIEAGNALDLATRDLPPVQHARRQFELARRSREETRVAALQAVDVIRASISGVETVQPIPDADAGTTLHTLKQFLDWVGPRLTLLSSRQKLLTEWRGEVSGKTEQLHPELIRYADVIGATCVGAASRSEISEVDFDLAIVDEAGQIEVANLLIPLVRAKRSVLVGDHRQLPPYVDTGVVRWGAENGDAVVRTLLAKSGLEILVDGLPKSHVVRLTQQRRMPKIIADFISDMFYDGTLQTKVVREHNPALFSSPLAFVDTYRLPDRHRTEAAAERWDPRLKGGFVNHAEARMLAMLAEYYHQSDVEWALIAPYAAQVKLISSLLRSHIPDSDAIEGNVGTVDSFQGGERDVILYGFTRSNSGGYVGFLDELRRANVAFTRAKKQLVLVGDMHMLLRAKDHGFRELARSLRDHVKATGDVRQYEELKARLEALQR